MGQTCICCKGNRVAYVLDQMQRAKPMQEVQERGCDTLFKLCSSGINGNDYRRDFGRYDGVEYVKSLFRNFKKQELVERAALRLFQLVAQDVGVAERMNKLKCKAMVQELMDEEFDDDYIQKDGEAFLQNLEKSLTAGGLEMLEDAEIVEDIAMAVRAMLDHDDIVVVQQAGMQFLHDRFMDAENRRQMVEAGGMVALVAVLEKHQADKRLVRMACDIIYHMAKHDTETRAEFGKKDAIHYLAMVYRAEVENPQGDMLQLLLYTLTELCRDNERNALRWGNRRGAKLIVQTKANIRTRLYERPMHVPFVFDKICAALPEPQTDAQDMGLPEEFKWDDLSAQDKMLKEMQLVGKRQLAAPKTRMEKEKQRVLLEVRARSAAKQEKQRKRELQAKRRALAEQRRKQELQEVAAKTVVGGVKARKTVARGPVAAW